jgi:predicted permease
VGGLLLAQWLASLLVAFRPPLPVAINFDVPIDARVVAYTALLTIVTTIVFGVVPALNATKGDLSASMKHLDGATGGRARRYGLRNLMLVPQVALSLSLLIVAGLFGRSVASAAAVPIGVDVDHTAMLAFNLAPAGFDEARAHAFHDRLKRLVLTIPGVQDAAVTDRVPLDLYGSQQTSLYLETGRDEGISVQHARVEPAYFNTLGIRVVGGRGFSADEATGNRDVAIVSEAAAKRYWPGRDPIGQRMRLDEPNAPLLEVIGVVSDAKVQSLSENAEPLVYRPLSTGYPRLLRMVVRTGGDSRALLSALRGAASEVDPSVALFESKTMTEHVDVMMFPFRMAAALSSALGLFALVLASIGLYGLLSYGVVERTRELAIRIALGARAGSVLRLVVADVARVVAIGLIVGMAIAFAASRALAGWLFGITATDPVTFLLTPVTLLIVAVVASVVPVRRATAVDPLQAMRE